MPNFKEPPAKHASKVLLLLALVVLTIFGGTSLLAFFYQKYLVVPHGETVLSQLAGLVYGRGFMYYVIQFTTALILAFAANTTYADFPMLLSVKTYKNKRNNFILNFLLIVDIFISIDFQ